MVGKEERHVTTHGAGADYADLYEVRSMVIIFILPYQPVGPIDWAEI